MKAPWGATRAVVIDERGDEHLVPVQDAAGLEVVRFEDTSGAIVPAPLPEGERTRVPDAPEPCPACAAVAWIVVASEVCCERCGFRLGRLWSADRHLATSVSVSARLSAEAGVVERKPLTVPAYAVPGLNADARRSDELGRVTVEHDVPGQLRTTTSTRTVRVPGRGRDVARARRARRRAHHDRRGAVPTAARHARHAARPRRPPRGHRRGRCRRTAADSRGRGRPDQRMRPGRVPRPAAGRHLSGLPDRARRERPAPLRRAAGPRAR